MPWWMWIWACFLALMAVAGVLVDLAKNESRLYTAVGFLIGVAWLLFVLNYGGVVRLGNLAPEAVAVLVAFIFDARADLRKEDDELSPVERYAIMAVASAPFVAAIVLGFVGPPES